MDLASLRVSLIRKAKNAKTDNIDNPLKNLSTIPVEFHWNSTGVMENDWKMTGTNGTSEIPLKFRWNSSSS